MQKKHLAKKLEVTKQTLSHIIHGRRRIPYDAANRLSALTDIAAEEILAMGPAEIRQLIENICNPDLAAYNLQVQIVQQMRKTEEGYKQLLRQVAMLGSMPSVKDEAIQ